MFKLDSKTIYAILNGWLAFLVLLYFSSHLPRWDNFGLHPWINVAIYFFLFLITFAILLKDKNNRDVFLNLSLFFLTASFSFIYMFIGTNQLFGDDYLLYRVVSFKQLVFAFSFAMFVIYATVKYASPIKKTWFYYAVTLLFLLPFFIYRFYPYIFDSGYIFEIGGAYSYDMSTRLLHQYLYLLVFNILFLYWGYKKDAVMGQYINTLMIFVFVFIITSIVHYFSVLYKIEIFSIAQYILMFNLIGLSYVLFKKLCFLNTDYGQFYEAMVNKKISLGKLRIQHQDSQKNTMVLLILKLYVRKRWSYILSLIWISVIIFCIYRFPHFFTINLAVILFSLLIIFTYLNALYKKREKNQHTLPL